ncbi:TPA: hypothetical protein EYO12_00985 [Candidatus Saccharibacteria bacterium]|nr:hypothetical protein [Candidatus Saccharibacteria bacterium]HIO87293.1 hypothetical protein [Candidatus Saccharibacteria bacterium]
MNKTLIGAGLAVALLGAVGFVVLNNNSDDTSQSSQTESSTTDANGSPFSFPDSNFRIIITTTENGTNTVGTIEVEDADTYRMDIEGEDGGTFIVDGTDFYTIDSEGTTLKLPNTASQMLDSSSFTQLNNDPEFNALAEEATSIGTGDCAVGTCDIYEFTDEEGITGQIKVNDGRVIEVTGPFNEGEQVSIVYDYNADVSIEIPTEFETVEIPEIDASQTPQ